MSQPDAPTTPEEIAAMAKLEADAAAEAEEARGVPTPATR